MSVIGVYNEPIDIYLKLVREGSRTWRAVDALAKSDHFFNFCVTSISLRDWIASHIKLSSGDDANSFYKLHAKSEWLNYCGCIANQSKHFRLEVDRRISVSEVSQITDTFAPIFPDGKVHEEFSISRPSLKITTSDGVSKDLMLLLFSTCEQWEEIFSQYGLKRPDDSLKKDMFLEMFYPK